jgi:hypothetical protein
MASASRSRTELALLLCPVWMVIGGCYMHSPDHPKRICIPEEALELPIVRSGEVSRLAELARPFDADRRDALGPDDRFALFGKAPEIIALPDGDAVDVLLQNHEGDEAPRALLLRLVPVADDYVITAVATPPVLDRIMGFARDEAGAFYFASGMDEASDELVDDGDPAPKAHRERAVRLVKLDADGEVAFDLDLDLARSAVDADAAPLVGPMLRSSARLAYGGGRLALVHGIAMAADADGRRDQKAVTTLVDATTGEVLETSTLDVPRSVDARIIFDGHDFVEMHLGGTDSRGIVLGQSEASARAHSVFRAKGDAGDENLYARLGGLSALESDGPFGYIALFATERTASETPIHEGERYVAGARDLAIVRVRRDFAASDPDAVAPVDPALEDAFDVVSSGEAHENHVRFLTQYQAMQGGAVHAERPKLVALRSGLFMVLWERWEHDPSEGYVFTGTWGLVIDAEGTIREAPTELTQRHLPRGDDAFALGDGAAFLTGDAASSSLHLHRIDADLTHAEIVIE